MSSIVSRIVELGTVVDHDRLSISRYKTTMANVCCTCAVPFLVSCCWQKTYDYVRCNRLSSVVSRIVKLGKIVDHDRLSISRYKTTLANFAANAQCLFLVPVVGKRHENCVMNSVVSRIVELGKVVDHNRLNIDIEPPWEMFTAHAPCFFSLPFVGKYI